MLARITSLRLAALDAHLLQHTSRPQLGGFTRFVVEFLYFGIKEARACLFVALFFMAVIAVPRNGIAGIPRTTCC